MASRSLLRRLAFSEVALPPSALAAPIKSIDVQMVAAGGTAGNTAARYVLCVEHMFLTAFGV